MLCEAICGGLSLALAWFTDANSNAVTPFALLSLLIPVALCILLPLVAIFLYRNMRRQKQLLTVSRALKVCALVVAIIYAYMQPALHIVVGGPLIFAIGALFNILAMKAIRRDEKLLRSADRLR